MAPSGSGMRVPSAEWTAEVLGAEAHEQSLDV
jgi:hypothetical protein